MSETRAIAAFTGFGVVLVGGALAVSRVTPAHDAPSSQPAAPAATVVVAPPVMAPPPPGWAAKGARKMLQHPSLSRTQIAFDYAGEIWVVGRDGGEAQRLVTGQLLNSRPVFSPDGSQIAFTGLYDDNADVYVVPAAGGEPRRLTYHPSPDEPVGWTPDGTKVLFKSMRATARDLPKLFTVPLAGGLPDPLPLPSGDDAAFSPDGSRLAYVPFQQWQPGWTKYRGGQATPIWLANLGDSHVAKVPRTDSNDRFPMWVGDTVYFVSDRNGPFTLFACDAKGGAGGPVRELLHNPDGLGVRFASAGPGALVYEQLDGLHLYDLASGTAHLVPVSVSADLPQVRPRFVRIGPHQVLHAALSPTGKRALFESHGEILSVPAEKGDVRNLTNTSGVADRDPAWSPDGKTIAWLSDETGEYALYLRSPDGIAPVKRVDLGDPPSYFYGPQWSPDSKKIVLGDKRLNLWLVDVEHPTAAPLKIETNRFEGFEGLEFDPSWSPDSRWIAYKKQLPNHLHGTFIYSVEDKKTHQVTDAGSDTSSPRFDASGKYLWFLARTDVGLGQSDGIGMTSIGRATTSSVYGIVLQKDHASPVAPESDEEGDAGAGGIVGGSGKDGKPDKGAKGDNGGKGDKGDKGDSGDKDKKDAKDKPVPPVQIDFDGIDQRIVALPIDHANYHDLEAGPDGVLFLLRFPTAFADEDYVEFDEELEPPLDVLRFDLKKRKTEPFVDGIDPWSGTFIVSHDRKKALYTKDKKWFLVDSEAGPKGADKETGGVMKGAMGMEVWVDPRAEWRQIYHEVWRIERDFLYDPHFHGLDLAATEKLYAPWLEGIAGRDDLNALLTEALSNLVLGHVWSGGGEYPRQERVSVGVLGADFRIDQGRYQFARILRGENWNPSLRAPLTEPGVDVQEGDFLLAVNGQDLKGTDEVYRLLLGRAGKQTVITVGPRADGSGSREVVVVPTGGESRLRLRTWMEDNRKKVDALSGGRVGYVYVPDTAAGGFTNFNRYFFSQTGKDGVVIDERFNHGGFIADYIVNILGWTPQMGAMTREGEDITVPSQAIFGPKVMIANEMSGSGGDALPWLFKRAGLGPLVGTRTWGGLVGIGGYPRLIDGGRVTAPRYALYGIKGEWEVENHGIAPDVEVEQDPALVRQGHDPQLERAVQLALDALAKNPPKPLVRPAYPDYGPRLPRVAPAAPSAAP
jgi:tricorn protease